MLRLNDFTDKSKKCILLALRMTKDCGYKFVEPQLLMAGIVNEGRDMLSFTLQYVNVDRIAFCKKINESICSISEHTNGEPEISRLTEHILSKAKTLSEENNCELVPVEFLFYSTILVPSSIKSIFSEFNVSESDLFEAISSYRRNSEITHTLSELNSDSFPYLLKYGKNLCAEVQNGNIPNVIGRDDEIRRMIHIISRQTKNNPILVGEPGTGKTAIVEGLAHRIVNREVPRELQNIVIFSLDVTSLIAGASHMGEFEERLKGVIEDLRSSNGQIILFIDEIHLLIGEGRNGGAMDAANIMKPELARGQIKVIGATTHDEYKKYIEQDKAFERRFQKVVVSEPDEESALAIIRGIRVRLEEFHKIRIKDEAIRAVVKLSIRYIQDRFLPDKAIDLLDEASAKMKIARSSSPIELDSLRRKITTKEIECESLKRDDSSNPLIAQLQEEITNLKEELNSLSARWQTERHMLDEIQSRRNDIARFYEEKRIAESQGAIQVVVDLAHQIQRTEDEVRHLIESLEDGTEDPLLKPEMDEQDVMSIITQWTGIPATKLKEGDMSKLSHIEEYLSNRVIGQDEAKITVANAIRRNRLGFSDESKPIGSFLFLGTTGVGKTEICKALSEFLFDSHDALIRIDMSEYQQEHEVSKLFGAPPGYIGHEDGGQLTEAVRKRPYSVVLFDEIEKAHPKVFETLLQILDDGRMTDGKGRTINFKNTIIVMTSNLGQQIIYSTLQGQRTHNRPRIGFVTPEPEEVENNPTVITSSKIEKSKRLILKELKSKVAPEFINRIDDIVMFLPLSRDDVKQIVHLQIKALSNKLKAQGIVLDISENAIEFLSSVGYQPEYGARPIKRAINSFLVDDLSLCLINGHISSTSPIKVNVGNNSLVFTN